MSLELGRAPTAHHHLSARRLHRPARAPGSGLDAALAFRDAIRDARGLRVVWVTQEIEREGWAVLERYADLGLSLTDAIGAAVALRMKIETTFTSTPTSARSASTPRRSGSNERSGSAC